MYKVSQYLDGLGQEILRNSKSLLLAGSTAEGLATDESDIDLVLITDTPEWFETPSGNYLTKEASGVRGEILVITPHDFLENITVLNRGENPLSFNQLDLIRKLTHGKVVSGDHYFNEITSGFDVNEFQWRLHQYLFQQAADCLEDLAGAKANNIPLYGIDLTRQLLYFCLEGLLVSRGDTYIRKKWRFPRAARTLNDLQLQKEYIQRELNAPVGGNEEQWDWIVESLFFCRKLQATTFFPELTDLTQSMPAREGPRYQACPWSLLVKNRDRFFLKTFKKTYEIDQLSASLLALLFQPLTVEQLEWILLSGNYLPESNLYIEEISSRLSCFVELDLIVPLVGTP